MLLNRARFGWRDADDAYVVSWVNNIICFREDGVLLTASITPGTYSDLELASLVKQAMDQAGGTYSVVRDGDTERFMICRLDSASAFELVVSGCGSSIFGIMGYLADRSGAACYAAELPTPAMVYLDLIEPTRAPAYSASLPDRKEHRALSGRRWFSSAEAMDRHYEASFRTRGFAIFDEFKEFLHWALEGEVFRYWPDQTNASRWVSVQLLDKDLKPAERLPDFKSWDWRLKFGQAGNNTGTIDLEDCVDR